MTANLIVGDQVSCSRVGGAMRRESSRLRHHAQSLADALADLEAAQGPATIVATVTVAPISAIAGMASMAAIATSLRALRATADDLDEAGAALQRYATDLAEGHELGRRAERRVERAGLLLEGSRVVEPWGPASARDAEHRRAQVPEVQSRVDLATAHVGRARGRLERELMRLTDDLAGHSLETRSARQVPLPPRGS
jgi:hypothetical protein